MSAMFLEQVDITLVLLYIFWIFFIGLIIYLRREDRREGYPQESEITGKPEKPGLIFFASPKTFHLPDGSTRTAPHDETDNRTIKGEPVAPWPGAPLEPIGDPMLDAIGPGAYAQRDDEPDLTFEGKPKIVPMSSTSEIVVSPRDPDPRGMPVVAADRKVAGKVTDVWVDQSEAMIRYLEVELEAGGGDTGEGEPAAPSKVLVPSTMARISSRPPRVEVSAILASQFANVPGIKSQTQVTRLEEDRICAYYAAGKLYATPGRLEPLF